MTLWTSGIARSRKRPLLRPFALGGLLLLGVAYVAPAQAETAIADAFTLGVPQKLVAGAAVVKFRDLSDDELRFDKSQRVKQTLDAVAARTGVALSIDKMGVFSWHRVKVRDANPAFQHRIPDEATTARFIDRLRSDPAFSGVSIDGWRRPLAQPNDPAFESQWHYDIINAPEAWDITVGSASNRVAVVDTGTVVNHEDLNGKDITGFDFVSDPGRANDGDGWDADYSDAGDGADCGQGFQPSSYHGTHVAGTVLAETNNNQGVAGMNWNAGLVTVRVMGKCGGDDFDILNGTAWSLGFSIDGVPDISDANTARVANLSLGGAGGCSNLWSNNIPAMNDAGAIIVAAAGNDSGPVGSPANCNGIIAVGSFGQSGARSSFSSFGAEIDIVGPGGDSDGGVASTSGPNNDGYSFQVGTSMASPHVAGAVSLMLDVNPGLTRTEVVALFDQDVSCTNCNGKPALQIDQILADVTPGEPEPEPTPQPEPEPTPTPDDDMYEENQTIDTGTPINCGDTLELFAAEQNWDVFRIDESAGTDVTITLTTDAATDLDVYAVDGMNLPDDILARAETPSGSETLTWTSDGSVFGFLVNPWFDQNNNDYNTGAYTAQFVCSGGEPEPAVEPEPSVQPEPEPSAQPEPEPSAQPEPEPSAQPEPEPGVGVEPSVEPEVEPSQTPLDPTQPDSAEPNDSLETAEEIVCNRQHQLTRQSDEDWFVVEVPQGRDLQVTTEGYAGLVTFEVKDESGGRTIAQAEEGYDDGLLFARVADAPGGRYVIQVDGAPDEAADTGYALRVYCGDERFDVEPAGCTHVQGGASSRAAGGAALFGIGLLLHRRRRRTTSDA